MLIIFMLSGWIVFTFKAVEKILSCLVLYVVLVSSGGGVGGGVGVVGVVDVVGVVGAVGVVFLQATTASMSNKRNILFIYLYNKFV
jgi:hypothetical protein